MKHDRLNNNKLYQRVLSPDLNTRAKAKSADLRVGDIIELNDD